ncbi:peptide deformylase [Candidatus Acetothermia bacterium]|jgi:peptide deformylase|nr:peptide deformylase [Candidatus Acetothermia bacterium]MCI2427799.1 peptide deformylase [Candidatus Acetothermia bacterium]MCI2428288.1 peptide deformylase [Candidatus Acetothermia bacterium]
MEIRKYGDTILRRKALPIENIDGEVQEIVTLMIEAMLRADGVGIAAPQIGISKRVIIINLSKDRLYAIVNPEIVWASEDEEPASEGCLSIPGIRAEIIRKRAVKVKGFDLQGRELIIDTEGDAARAVQHEIDHLNGILFIDYLSKAKRTSLLKEYHRKLNQTE